MTDKPSLERAREEISQARRLLQMLIDDGGHAISAIDKLDLADWHIGECQDAAAEWASRCRRAAQHVSIAHPSEMATSLLGATMMVERGELPPGFVPQEAPTSEAARDMGSRVAAQVDDDAPGNTPNTTSKGHHP